MEHWVPGAYRRSSLMDKDLSDNNAYTLSATLYDGTLKLYTTHSAHQQGRTVYYTKAIQAYMLENDLDTFQQGLTALRSARRWALAQR